jgi:hypothetical protein
MLSKASNAEALFQTPEQQREGKVVFRVYIDEAWRNVEGPTEWKQLQMPALIANLEQVYEAHKSRSGQ